MKDFLYLVQGTDSLVKNYFFLRNRKSSDLLASTYNKPLEGTFFFKNTTWAEGRNLLLEKALDLEKEYDYYIFVDDDISFHKGDFDLFEEELAKLKPAVAVPVFLPKTTHTVIGVGVSFYSKFFMPFKNYQVCHHADGQFMAFHKDVINDRLLMPLQNQFDHISWWFTSSTQQLLAHNLYQDHFLQFNNVSITNDSHRDYAKNEYKDEQQRWFQEQFKVPLKDPRKFAVNLISLEGIKYAIKHYRLRDFGKTLGNFLNTIFRTIRYRKKNHHHLSTKKLKKILSETSELFRQHQEDKSVV